LAVALAEGKSMLEATRFANAAAAIAVTRVGAQASAPKRKEIEAMLESASVSGNGHTMDSGVDSNVSSEVYKK
jgi:bifunctional ADP-heptose synthase (sugar kinase/adenylyltransferase)